MSKLKSKIVAFLDYWTLDTTLKCPAYSNKHRGRVFLVVATGPSARKYDVKLNQFIQKYNPVIIGANNVSSIVAPDYHCFTNKKRFSEFSSTVADKSKVLLSPYFSKNFVRKHYKNSFDRLMFVNDHEAKFDIVDGVIQASCRSIGVLMIAIAVVMGAKEVYVYGLDGYSDILNKGGAINYYNGDNTVNNTRAEKLLSTERYNRKFLKEIDKYFKEKIFRAFFIITPTVYSDYYKNIDDLI